MQIRLGKKTKAGHWNANKVDNVFKSLKDQLNSYELTNLTEYLIANGNVNMICLDLMKAEANKLKTEQARTDKAYDEYLENLGMNQ